MKIALDPTPFHHDYELLEFPRVVAELGYEHLQLTPHRDFIPFFNHPRADDDLVAKFRKACARRRSRHRVGAAGAALVGPRRGRPRSGGAQLEARHPDHRRPRRQRHQHRVLRPAGTGRGVRAGVLPLHGGAAADLRARGHRRPHRPAPRRLRRGRAGGGAHHPRGQLPQRRHGVRRVPHVPHGRQHDRHHACRGRQAAAGARRRHHGSPPQPRPALHHQPAGQSRPGAPAPQDRRRRRRLGRVLLRARRDRVLRPPRHRDGVVGLRRRRERRTTSRATNSPP